MRTHRLDIHVFRRCANRESRAICDLSAAGGGAGGSSSGLAALGGFPCSTSSRRSTFWKTGPAGLKVVVQQPARAIAGLRTDHEHAPGAQFGEHFVLLELSRRLKLFGGGTMRIRSSQRSVSCR